MPDNHRHLIGPFVHRRSKYPVDRAVQEAGATFPAHITGVGASIVAGFADPEITARALHTNLSEHLRLRPSNVVIDGLKVQPPNEVAPHVLATVTRSLRRYERRLKSRSLHQ